MQTNNPSIFNDLTLLIIWLVVMALCVWGFVTALDSGWIVGLPVVVAFSATRILAFGKDTE